MLDRMQRWWYRQSADPGPMRSYLSVERPSPRDDARRTEYLALDLETTGLEPNRDAIVSVGHVPIVGRRIRCADARHEYVRLNRSVKDSATIHHIRDADLDDGCPEADALAAVLFALRGRVLLVHHAPVDLRFLQSACRRLYDRPLLVRVVDTLDLARRRRARGNRQIQDDELRLHALRRSYNLPRYPAHDALSDAVATAELFLAMLPEWCGDESLPLRTILR